MSKTKLFYNKVIYVGMGILDISRTLMYEFHYDVIKKRYGDDAQLQYKETDSLTYLIKTNNWYDDMKTMMNLFDTSDYPYPNRLNMPLVNKKVLGKMKDKLNGRVMFKHIGLRSRMYASKSEHSEQGGDGIVKKTKGVNKVVIKDHITFDDYKECLDSGIRKNATMNLIRSFSHDMYSVHLNKVALSASDDKRCILDDGIHTLPWGHYSILNDVIVELTFK